MSLGRRDELSDRELEELSTQLKVGQIFLHPADDKGKIRKVRITKIERDKEHDKICDTWIYFKYLDGFNDANGNTCRAWFIVQHCEKVGGKPFVFR